MTKPTGRPTGARSHVGAGSIRRSSLSFRDKLRQLLERGKFTPSTWLLDRLNDGRVKPADKDRIALGLVQYELPRLQAIEAEIANVEKSHEEWLMELEGSAVEETTLQ